MSMGSAVACGPLVQVGLWGRPWHGRIDHNPFGDAVNTWRCNLPNGTVKNVRPIGDVAENLGDFTVGGYRRAFLPMSGSNAVFERSDVPAITRTPSHAAEDAAAGRQWWSKAIVHGQGVLGSSVEWVWCDNSGVRWLVRWFPVMGEGYIRVTLRRFGSFGGPREDDVSRVLETPFTAASLGQDEPALPAGTPQPEFTVADVTSVGDRALIMVGELSGNYGADKDKYLLQLLRNGIPPGDAHLYYAPVLPIGWIEVTMSGTPGSGTWGASVSVVADRAATMGTRAMDWSPGREHRANKMTSETSPEGWPDVPGLAVSRVITATGAEDVSVASIGGFTGGWATYYRGTDTYRASVSGAIVGMHYEAAGIATYTADWTWTHSLTEDSAFTYSGDEVWHYVRAAEGDVWQFSGLDLGRVRTATYTGSGEISETWTLRRNGAAVSTWESGLYETCEATGTSLLSITYGENEYFYDLQASSVSGEIRLCTNGDEITVPRTLDGSGGMYGKGFPLLVFSRFGWSPSKLSDNDIMWGAIETPPVGIFGPSVAGPASTLESSRWRRFLIHYSQCCLGYIAFSNQSADDTILRVGELSTPSGVEPPIPPTAYNPTSRPLAFASYNPVTGAVARSEWPVNWL